MVLPASLEMDEGFTQKMAVGQAGQLASSGIEITWVMCFNDLNFWPQFQAVQYNTFEFVKACPVYDIA